jgi:hypothetical protein
MLIAPPKDVPMPALNVTEPPVEPVLAMVPPTTDTAPAVTDDTVVTAPPNSEIPAPLVPALVVPAITLMAPPDPVGEPVPACTNTAPPAVVEKVERRETTPLISGRPCSCGEESRTTSPDLLAESAVPAATVMAPAEPVRELPVRREMAPDTPPNVTPVPTTTDPEDPDLVVPLLNTKNPESPTAAAYLHTPDPWKQ